MKKGQIQIIFTWIFILILAGAILFYGVNVLKKTVNLGEDAVIIDFFKKLDNKFELYYSLDEGSTSVEEFKLSNKVKYVCFTKDGDLGDIPSDIVAYKDEYLDKLKEFDNVFLIPPVGRENRVTITKLDIEKNPVCVELEGDILKLRLKTTVGGVDVEAA